MWSLFFLTVAATIAILYLPGFFLLKSVKLSALVSLICAPIISIVIYEILGIVYAKVGIFGSWLTMVAPMVAFSCILFCGSLVLGKKASACASRKEWAILALYVVVAFALALFYFAQPLNGPMSFSQGPDNSAHLGYIQNFMEAGNYSTLSASFYHGIGSSYESPMGGEGGGFYPTAWHCVAALAGSLTGANAALSANASLLVFLAVVFPAGVFLFMKALVRKNDLLIACGSIVSVAFGAFPWGLLSFGPLFPNFASFVVIPTVVSVFLLMNEPGIKRYLRAEYLALFIAGLLALALLQTNAVFTTGVILVPFCAGMIWKAAKERYSNSPHKLLFQIVFSGAFILLCAALWYAIYKMPFMQGVVSYPWPPFGSLRQEFVNVLVLSYCNSPAQPLLGLLVLLGIGYLLTKRENRWLVVAYGITCFLCFVAASGSGDIRSLFVGFWYTDSYRIAAMAALAGIPLAVYGTYVLIEILKRVWNWLVDRLEGSRVGLRWQVSLISIGLIAAVYYPNFTLPGIGNIQTALGVFESNWFNTNNNVGACVLDGEEQAFLQEVSRIVPEGDLVLNKPDDGSVFAYGGFGIDVYYKRTGMEAFNTDSDDSKLIRLKIDEYADNEKVREAVKRSGSKYLLLLDQNVYDESQERFWFDHYYEDFWVGIDAVTDDTPGFKVVLAEGDMRLYEILPVD